MTTQTIDLKALREAAMKHTSRFPVLALLDLIENQKAALETAVEALRFYAKNEHFEWCGSEDDEEPETPSGELENWVCGDGPFNVECGMIALAALSRLAELGVG